MTSKNALTFVDIFSGAGGFSKGLEMAGFHCLLGIEHDKYAAQTFLKNHKNAKVFCGDVKELSKKEFLSLCQNKKIDLVIGGPPCQGFSTVGIGNPNDPRNMLFREFLRIVKIANPNYIVIENVTGLLAKKNENTIKAIFKLFQGMGYAIDVKVLSSEDYGVPEKRRRTIFIGSKKAKEISFPKAITNCIVGNTFIPPKTVGDAFKNLKTKNGSTYNHDLLSAKLKSTIDLKRISKIPEGKGIRYQEDEKKYLPKSLGLNVDWTKIPEGRFRQTKYQRLSKELPSPTIMTHRHNYFHPTENRYLTAREAASIQSFPNDFIFEGPVSSQWRQIGNAVPPLLGKAIGRAILEMEKEAKRPRKMKSKLVNLSAIRKRAFSYQEIQN